MPETTRDLAARAAWVLRAILNEIGLRAYPKPTAAFDVRTIAARLAGPDPWSEFWSSGQSLPSLATPARARRRTIA
jgi:hypothetical protein